MIGSNWWGVMPLVRQDPPPPWWGEAIARYAPELIFGVVMVAALYLFFRIFQTWMNSRESNWLTQLNQQRADFKGMLEAQAQTFSLALEEQRASHEATLRERDEAWREAMTDGRKRQGESLAEVAQKMAGLTELLRSLHTVFTTHDAYERETWQRVGQQLSEINRR